MRRCSNIGKFTEDELFIAKSVDLVDLAGSVGIGLRRRGSYYQVEGISSAMIFNRSTWCRFSQQGVGGSTIDFLMYFKDMEYKEAVSYLLDYAGYIKTDILTKSDNSKLLEKLKNKPQIKKEKAPFVLPEKSENCRRLFAYLIKQRRLSKEVIEYWLKNDLMYESLPHHNIVFQGKDVQGEVKFASQRGTLDLYREPYKADVKGNDKSYGVNLINPECRELSVYEAAIDAMSYMDFRKDFSTSILVLGMLWDKPLEKLLEHEEQIKKINVSLDNDLWGRQAAKKIARKYILAGYEVSVGLPPFGKDHNAFLKMERENRSLCKQLCSVKSRKNTVGELSASEPLMKGSVLYFPQGTKSFQSGLHEKKDVRPAAVNIR